MSARGQHPNRRNLVRNLAQTGTFEKEEKEKSHGDEDDTCPLCLDALSVDVQRPLSASCNDIVTKKQPPCTVYKLPCRHRFHYGCIVRYIGRAAPITVTGRKHYKTVLCPICRQPFSVISMISDEVANREDRADGECYWPDVRSRMTYQQ